MFIVLLALFFGALMFVFDFGDTSWLAVLAAHLFFLSYVTYPKKDPKTRRFQCSYGRRKAHDFSFVFLHFMVISLWFNGFLVQQPGTFSVNYQEPAASFIVYKQGGERQVHHRKEGKLHVKKQFKKLLKDIRHDLRKIREQVRAPKENRGIMFLRFLLLSLTLVIAYYLFLLVGALACELSCTSAPGTANVVLVLGTLGIFWLIFIAADFIFRHVGVEKEKG